jgi:hypothetical protein
MPIVRDSERDDLALQLTTHCNPRFVVDRFDILYPEPSLHSLGVARMRLTGDARTCRRLPGRPDQ